MSAARGRKRTPRRKLAECVFRKGFVTEQVDPLVDEMWRMTVGGKTPFGDLRNMFRRHHCRTLNPYGDSENCPYDEKDCARAFYVAVRETCRAHRSHKLLAPVGYFIRVAKSSGARRADEAVGLRAAAARARLGRTVVPLSPPDAPSAHGLPTQATEEPHLDPGGLVDPVQHRADPRPEGGLRGVERDGGEPARGDESPTHPGVDRRDADPRLPGSAAGPVSVGDLFRSLALGPRPGPEQAEERDQG